MNKTFWAIIAVIVIVFGGIVVFNKKEAATPSANGSKLSSHIVGEGKSGVTLIEYGDFQCPACGAYYPMVEQVKEKYKDQIFFQFRNLPLLQIHPHAFAAARAAEAAHKQGKFWEMYNLLYQEQKNWTDTTNATKQFEQYATQLGLNLAKYKADAASAQVNSIINADIDEFKKSKEELSTPAFFLDGKRIKPMSIDEFTKLIDEAIAKKSSTQ